MRSTLAAALLLATVAAVRAAESGTPAETTGVPHAFDLTDQNDDDVIDRGEFHDRHVEVFYFAAFDEAWKVGAEGDVGAFWGLWDKDGQPKFTTP